MALACRLWIVTAALMMAPAAPCAEPELRVALRAAHEGGVGAVAFSADGRYLATGGDDFAVRLWHVETGALLRTWTLHEGKVWALAFSPDGRMLVSGALGGRTLADPLEGHGGWSTAVGEGVRAIAFSPDGATVLTEQVLRDAADGRPIRTFPTEQVVEAVAFAPAGDRAVLVEYDPAGSVLTVVHVADGTIERRLRSDTDVKAVAFADARTIVAAGPRIEAWDVETGAPRRIAELDGVASAAVSADGRRVVVRGPKRATVLLDAVSGRVVRELGVAAGYGPVALGGTRVAAGGSGVVVEEVDRGERAALERVAEPTCCIDFAGTQLVTGGAALRVWDLGQAGLARTIAVPSAVVSLAATERLAVSGHDDGALRAWDLRTGSMRAEIPAHDLPVRALALTPDGALAITGSAGGKDRLRAWDLATGREVRSWSGHEMGTHALAMVGADRFVSGGGDGRAVVRRIDGKGKPLALEGHAGWVTAVAAPPDGSRVATGCVDGRLRIYDAVTGERLHVVSTLARGQVRAVGFAPDGRLVVASEGDGGAELWTVDPATGEVLEEVLFAHDGAPTSLAWAEDGRFLALAGADGVVDVRMPIGADPGQLPVVSLAGWGDDWLIFTPEGLFDGSRRGTEALVAIRGLQAFDAEQIAVRNNRPDLLIARLGVGHPAVIALFEARHRRRAQRLGLDPERLDDPFADAPRATITSIEVDGDSADVGLRVDAGAAELVRLHVTVNGVPMDGAGGRPIGGATLEERLRIVLSAGRNVIEVSATDASGLESPRDWRVAERDEAARGALWFVGFGVSRYADASLDLRYAHQDALDLAAAAERMGAGFDAVHTRALVDGAVTLDAIRDARTWLAGAGVHDTVVVFVAGHGAYTPEGEYAFFVHHTDPARLAETGAPFELVEALLDGIAPRRKLLLLDTCESGERDELPATEATATIPLVSRGIRVRTASAAPSPSLQVDRERFVFANLDRRTGAIVLSSSRGDELSYENDTFGNGVFTEHLLEALASPVADADGDGRVDTDELRAYVATAVSASTAGMQHPVVDRDNRDVVFGFPIVAP